VALMCVVVLVLAQNRRRARRTARQAMPGIHSSARQTQASGSVAMDSPAPFTHECSRATGLRDQHRRRRRLQGPPPRSHNRSDPRPLEGLALLGVVAFLSASRQQGRCGLGPAARAAPSSDSWAQASLLGWAAGIHYSRPPGARR
jgi:hypothetical protein